MRRLRRAERGVTVAATAIFMVALVAVMAIAVEVAHLTHTATEVQVSADAGALAGALAIAQGAVGQAVARGQNAAGANYAEGQAVPAGSILIEVGKYSSDPSANPRFTTGCTAGIDCNAAKATVTLDQVKYVAPTILNGSESTTMQKNAVASVQCQGSAAPLPMAVCDTAMASIPADNLCGTTAPPPFVMNPNGANNACWTSLSQTSANASYYPSIFPTKCGGTPVQAYLGDPTNLQNGVASSVWQALQCCIACQDVHDFTVPVVDCAAMGSCNTAPPIKGFATIHIATASDIKAPGGGPTNCNGPGPLGCGVQIPAPASTTPDGITASQICRSDQAGKPGGTGCGNFGNTVAPVLGQLP